MLTRPPALRAGARVALVAPAGPLRGDEDLARADENVRSFGWIPIIAEHARARVGYFAGDDAARLADLNRAIADPDIDAIWCLRGGYGAMRLLPRVDFRALGQQPKALIGYSDITALHCALQASCGLVSFHGPTARAVLDDATRASLGAAVAHRESCGAAPASRVIRDGSASGRIAGGNLALLSALVGTPWAPRLDGALLLLEDINEPVYRIDRMLRQLLLSGSLANCRGIIFGHCTNCPEEADDGGARALDDVLAELADELGVPCLAGVPVGHIASQWTVPLGVDARLDTASKSLFTTSAPGGQVSR